MKRILYINLAIFIFIFVATGIYMVFNSKASVTAEVIEQSDDIIYAQHQNGAIAMSPPFYPHDHKASPIWINPYFANYSGIALLNTYSATGDYKYKEAVRKYLDWYVANINDDGSIYDFAGYWSDPKSINSYDSTDSYAATFLVLVNKYQVETNDDDWINSNIDSIKKVTSAMLMTLDNDDNLTEAKPGYPVKYLMDNTEVRLGLIAASQLAKNNKINDNNFNYRYFSRKISGLTASLKYYWNSEKLAYNWAKQANSNYSSYDNDWDTSGKANSMILAFGLDLGSKRNNDSVVLLEKIKRDFYMNNNSNDLREYFFILMALNKFGFKEESSKLSDIYYKNIMDENLTYLPEKPTYTSHKAFYVISMLQSYNNDIFKNNLFNIR